MIKTSVLWRKSINFFYRIFRAVLVIGICFTILFPLFVKLSVSFMDERDLYDATVLYIPRLFTLNNFRMAFAGLNYFSSLFNSFLLSFSTSAIQLAACSLVAYGFARFNFPFKRLLFFMVILLILVPPQTTLLPLYMFFRYFDLWGFVPFLGRIFGGGEITHVNLLNTYWPFVTMSATVTGFKNGLFVYILRQHFRSIPKELEEAAYIDGCGYLKTFLLIVVPAAVPMLTTVFLFSFAWMWTDNFYSTLFLTAPRILSVALGSLAQNLWFTYVDTGLGQMTFISPGFSSIVNNAGTFLVIIPLVILYIFAQRAFVEGVERSGIVG